jgi:hypothetical protein
LTEFEVYGVCNGKEVPEASHPDDRGEGLCVVETHSLIVDLGKEAGFVARSFTLYVRLVLGDPHVVDDRAVCR